MTLWRGERPLLLASTSAARAALLRSAGLAIETADPGLDEASTALPSPDARAAHLAAAKATAVSDRDPDRWTLGGDQVLDLDGTPHGKPGTRGAAAALLAALSGRPHRLVSAYAIARGGRVVATGAAEARLRMRRLQAATIARYLDLAGEAVLRSAGGYEVEGLGIHLFESLEGEHSTILGLPLLPLLASLRGLGLLAL